MMKHITKYGHFFVLLAFLAGIIAPACSFAWGGIGAGKFSVVEICTAQGIESRIVENDQDPERPMAHEQCQFCFAQANFQSLMPVLAQFEQKIVAIERLKLRHYQAILFSRLSQGHAARAPPLFV